MTGLEKILAEIKADAEREAATQMQAARESAEKAVTEVEADTQRKLAELEAQTSSAVEGIKRAGDSGAALARRQRTLAAKQALLAETMDKALETLLGLPDERYLALLAKLIGANAQPASGEILLNARDKARLPAGFAAALPLPAGAALTVGEATRPIEGGFILKYGDIEENCSFRAIFDARREEFADVIAGILFE